MTRKIAVAIFAHPDDEAFGPSGTIYKLTKDYDVYLLCATKGEVGQDSSSAEKPLSEVRADEVRKSAKILGIKEVYFLGFTDGTLSNSLYHNLADAIESKLKELKPELIMTSSPTGGSGHIDHIVVSMVSSYVFERLPFIKEIWYRANSKEETDKWKNTPYFVYRPPGVPRDQIDKIVDVSDMWDVRVAAMQAHVSQKHDYERLTKMREGLPKEEYFTVRKKNN